MDPVTTASAVTAVTSVTSGDVQGVIDTVSQITEAIGQGNSAWAVALIVYALLELMKGRVPGTKIYIPQIPALLNAHIAPGAKQGLSMGLSAAVTAAFLLAGQPLDTAVSTFVTGWVGAMGAHQAFGAAGTLLGSLKKTKTGA